MSDLKEHIEFVNTINKQYRVLNKKKPVYELPSGIKCIDYRNMTSTNGSSMTGSQYQIFLNNNQILGDYIVEETSYDFTFTATCATANAYPLIPGCISPRLLPTDTLSQSVQITINGTPITFNPQDCLGPLMSFNNKPEYTNDLPCTMLDTFTDLVATTVAGQGYDSRVGALKNQMLDYFTSSYGINPRFCQVEIAGPLNNTQLVVGGNVNLTFRFVVRQPIFTGITSLTLENSSGFLGVTNVQINRTYVSNFTARLVELAAPTNITYSAFSAALTANTVPKIYYTVYTPPDDFKIEYPTFYPVIDYSVQSNTGGSATAAGGLCAEISSPTLSLSVIPRCFYVWLAVPASAKTVSSSDCPGFQITSINVQFNGLSGQFSGMSKWQIYENFMGRQGYNKNFYETGFATALVPAGAAALPQIGLYGSVCRIDIADIGGIDWSKCSVGSAFNSTFSVRVQGINLSANAQTPYLFVQVVNDAMLAVTSPTTSQLYKGILSEEEIQDIRKNAPYEYTHDPMIAGNIFKKIWNGVKSAAKWTYNNRDVIVPIARKLVGVGKHQKKHSAGALVTKSKLHRRLRGRGLDSESEISDLE